MRLKPGVKLAGIRPELAVAMQVAEATWRLYSDDDFVITSVTDGKHQGASLHYAGSAFDIRIHGLDPAKKKMFRDALSSALWDTEFDVVLEDLGLDNEHLHVEYQPKEKLEEA